MGDVLGKLSFYILYFNFKLLINPIHLFYLVDKLNLPNFYMNHPKMYQSQILILKWSPMEWWLQYKGQDCRQKYLINNWDDSWKNTKVLKVFYNFLLFL